MHNASSILPEVLLFVLCTGKKERRQKGRKTEGKKERKEDRKKGRLKERQFLTYGVACTQALVPPKPL